MTRTDFLTAPFPPAQPVPPAEITGPGRFFNRELSWLAFNWRVLDESANPAVPLLEQLRFLAISAANLDEFHMVRVAGLRQLARSGKWQLSVDGRSPAEQLALVGADVRRLLAAQQAGLVRLTAAMATAGITILSRDGLAAADHAFLREHFLTAVFPVLSPLAIDPAHPFPFIPSGGFCLGLELERRSDRRRLQVVLPIPGQIARFITLPAIDHRHRALPLEDLLLLNLGGIFPGHDLIDHCTFRVLRDSDLEIEDDAEDLMREFEIALKRRRRGEVVRLDVSAGAPPVLRGLIMAELRVTPDEVFETAGMIGLADLAELVLPQRPDLLWPPFTPRVPERLRDHDGDIFAAIRHKDLLLHHPYETFDLVIRFLQQAAEDPDVLAIRQTLYRTSHDSPIVDALCTAAEAGKSVTALVELKARFDEASNIRQSRRLEHAGVHVVYGFMHLKTHAKLSLVVRREPGRLVSYTHVGTGNYNPVTARSYTDLSLFTCDTGLGRDATRIFNYLSGYARPEGLENMAISPVDLKARLLTLIAAEIGHALAGRPAVIWAKLNALIDPELIDALYAASQAGVRISLIVRGICGLRPGVAGLSENIRVKSIVGRFLEHGRIICFGNGHELPAPDGRVFISSADWMGRNMNHRVETLVEIHNPTVKAQITDQIMAASLADTAQSWQLGPDGGYTRRLPASGTPFSCHRFFMENPSLSGRGSAGGGDAPRLSRPAAASTP